MPVNYALVFAATIAQFALGALWYSPLMFGKWWMEINDCTKLSVAELKAMQKKMGPFYALQFALTFFTTVCFANLLPYILALSPYRLAFWIWLGFILPVQIGAVIWGSTKQKYWVKQIVTMAGFQLASAMLMAWIISM